jgi:hypothetical protein
MATRIQWIVNHKTRQCTIAFAGDEYSDVKAPKGWQQIDIDAALQGRVEEWTALSRQQQLKMLCPEGYEAIFPEDGTKWVNVRSLNKIASPIKKVLKASPSPSSSNVMGRIPWSLILILLTAIFFLFQHLMAQP